MAWWANESGSVLPYKGGNVLVRDGGVITECGLLWGRDAGGKGREWILPRAFVSITAELTILLAP